MAWVSPGGGQALWHPQLCQGPGPRVAGMLGPAGAAPPGRRDWVPQLTWMAGPPGALLAFLSFLGALCFFLSLPLPRMWLRPRGRWHLAPAALSQGTRCPPGLPSCLRSLLPETPAPGHPLPQRVPLRWGATGSPQPSTSRLRVEGPQPQAAHGELSKQQPRRVQAGLRLPPFCS